MWYPKLRSPSNTGTLAVKVVREAYFGEDLLAKCTVCGDRGHPGLPIVELQQLKQINISLSFPSIGDLLMSLSRFGVLPPHQLASCARDFVITPLIRLLPCSYACTRSLWLLLHSNILSTCYLQTCFIMVLKAVIKVVDYNFMPW